MQGLRFVIFAIIISLSIYLVIIRPQQQYYHLHHVDIKGTYLINPIEISDFELIDTHGKSFNKSSLKNHWSLVFFGFTRCKMVCPLTLTELDKVYRSLQSKLPENHLPAVVFISIDTEQDNVSKLRNYVNKFNPHFVGVTTSKNNIESIKNTFHVTANEIVAGHEKFFDHTPEILLINPNAEIQAYFSYPHKAEQLEKDYYSIINKGR